jgi:hypothetical protein
VETKGRKSMNKTLMAISFSVMVCLMAVWPGAARAQGSFESVSGTAFVNAVPGDFYLEGNRIPTERRNSALLKNAKGSRVVVGLIDTTGYSSQIKAKYTGFLITETSISFGGVTLGVGSYGIGLDSPASPSTADATFKIYDQAGTKVGEGTAKRDESVKQPKPLGVAVEVGKPTKILFGRFGVEIQ